MQRSVLILMMLALLQPGMTLAGPRADQDVRMDHSCLHEAPHGQSADTSAGEPGECECSQACGSMVPIPAPALTDRPDSLPPDPIKPGQALTGFLRPPFRPPSG